MTGSNHPIPLSRSLIEEVLPWKPREERTAWQKKKDKIAGIRFEDVIAGKTIPHGIKKIGAQPELPIGYGKQGHGRVSSRHSPKSNRPPAPFPVGVADMRSQTSTLALTEAEGSVLE